VKRTFFIIIIILFLSTCNDQQVSRKKMLVSEILSEQVDENFAKAVDAREFSFPEDHGGHPQYRNEWWYLTGNLGDKNGQAFGYQVTFFRIGLSPETLQRESAWASNQMWMAHVALTDVSAQEHIAEERFSRGNPGLVEIQDKPFQIRLDDWHLLANENDKTWQLIIKTEEFSLNLDLRFTKPVVLHGDQGLSQKSETPGNATYYYSLTRINTSGQLKINNKSYAVNGLSWLDREWGTSALDRNQKGWDWFSIQLESGEELMYYQIRDQEGKPHPGSAGTWISKKGLSTSISPEEIQLTPIKWWLSETGARYPIRWQLDYQARPEKWIVQALVDDQIMDLSFSYWEGAVAILDSINGNVLGNGYLEMTGY